MAVLNSTESTFDRLTAVLQRGTSEDMRRLAQKNGFSKIEETALIYAHDALNTAEGDEARACDVFDRWIELAPSLMNEARTQREFELVDYADACVECVLRNT